MNMMIWNIALSAIVAVMGFLLKGKFNDLDRLCILLNKTREEIARYSITREEYNHDLEKLTEHFDSSVLRLENKIDMLVKKT